MTAGKHQNGRNRTINVLELGDGSVTIGSNYRSADQNGVAAVNADKFTEALSELLDYTTAPPPLNL